MSGPLFGSAAVPRAVSTNEPRVHAAKVSVTVDLEVDRFEEQIADVAAGCFIRKPLFTFPPYDFVVYIFPNGVSPDRKGRLCIFVGRRDSVATVVTGDCTIELFLPDWRPVPGDDLARATARHPLKLGPDNMKGMIGWELKALSDLRRQGFLADGSLCMRIHFAPDLSDAFGGRSIASPASSASSASRSLRHEDLPDVACCRSMSFASSSASRSLRTEALANDLKTLLDTGSDSDVVLATGGQEFRAGGGILSCRSPVFAAMLTAGMRETERKRIEVPDLEPTTLASLLRFLYTGSVEDEANPLDSPVGRWLYGCHGYQVEERNGGLLFTETTPKNGLLEGELTRVGPQEWFATLSNKATIKLMLRGMTMWGEYRGASSPDVNKTVAYSPDASVRTAERWGDLLRAGDKYCVQGLVAYCEQELQERLSVHNAAVILHIASEMGSQALKTVAMNYITQHEERMRAVQESNAFDTLDRELVAEISEVFFNPPGRRPKRRPTDCWEFPDGQDWDRLSNAQLRRACAERGWATSGGRTCLAARLRAAEECFPHDSTQAAA